MKKIKFFGYLVLSIIIMTLLSSLTLTEKNINYVNGYNKKLSINDNLSINEVFNSSNKSIDTITLIFNLEDVKKATKKDLKEKKDNTKIYDVSKYYNDENLEHSSDNTKKAVIIEFTCNDKKYTKTVYLKDLKYGANYIANKVLFKDIQYQDILISIKSQNVSEDDKLYIFLNDKHIYSTSTLVNGNEIPKELSVIIYSHVRTVLPIMFFIAIFTIGFLYITRKTKLFDKLNFAQIIIMNLVLSIMYSFMILKFNINLSGYEIFNEVYFIVAVICLLINLKLILEVIKKYKKNIEKIFIILAISLGTMYIFTILPNGVPDENYHYIQADKLSEFKIDNKKDYLIQKKFNSCGKPERNYKCLNEKIFSIKYSDPKTYKTNGSISYNRTLYIPSALGIKIGKLLNLRLYVGYYIARIFSLLITVLFGYYSIKLLPKGKLILFTYLLNPMYLQQGMAISADVLTNAITILFISLILGTEKFTTKRKILLLILLLGFTIIKIPYLFILILLLSRSKNKIRDRENKLIRNACIFGLVAVIAYTIFTNLNYTIYKEFTIMNILRNPLDYMIIVFNTLLNKGGDYFVQMFGSSLGWFEFNINYIYIISYMLILLLATMIDRIRLSRKQIIISMISVFFVVVSILTGFLTIYSTRSEAVIFGLQGRYFIPVFILVLYTLSSLFDKYKIEFKSRIKNYTSFISICLLIINILIILQLTNYMM